MEPVLTPTQMGEVDRQAIASGTGEATLIRRAGTALAWHARRMLGGTYGRRVVVVCGKGNNGADGRTAAAVLARWGVGVDVIELVAPLDAPRLARALDTCDLAIDAMYGTGFRGELDGAAVAVDDELYRAPRILSADIPSGVHGATGRIGGHGFVAGAVLAHETVTFGAYKPGLLFEPGRFHAGRVTVADIGLPIVRPQRVLRPGDTVLWTADDAHDAPLQRWPQDHKWSSAVVVVGGSPGMTGAPLLAASAAHRCGAGMVVVAAPGLDAANHMGGSEVVVAPVSGAKGRFDESSVDDVLRSAERAKAVVIGPGIGRKPSTARAVRMLVAKMRVPLVIDADALHAIGTNHVVLRERAAAGAAPAVLTPHDGEYRAITGRDVGADRLAAARALAADTNCIVLLKGPGTVVADPQGRAAIVANGGSELATAGTGDVLSGVIAALCTQLDRPLVDHDALATVASAAWIHADAGRTAALGPSTIASDVVAALPPTLERLRRTDPV